MPVGHGQLGLRTRLGLGRALRAQGYARAIVLPNSLKSALTPFWARIPRRTGFLGELRWGLLNDVRHLDKTRLPRMVERFVSLGLEPGAALPSPLPRPSLRVEPARFAAACEGLGIAPPTMPLLALCPGAEYGPAKRWPAAHFARLARAKREDGWAVWIFGSEKDAGLGEEINRHAGGICLDLTGKTRLADAVDLLASASVVVSNDSGLMHVAAALGRRLVVVYGSSTPAFTPPLTPRAATVSLGLACSPCFKRHCPLGHTNCLRTLSPRQVLAAMETLPP
jgi:heptosyltransferase-2